MGSVAFVWGRFAVVWGRMQVLTPIHQRIVGSSLHAPSARSMSGRLVIEVFG